MLEVRDIFSFLGILKNLNCLMVCFFCLKVGVVGNSGYRGGCLVVGYFCLEVGGFKY